MTRQQANELIVKAIKRYIENNPDWRFHQILQNMSIEIPRTDQWYEESTETLEKIKKLPVLANIFN